MKKPVKLSKKNLKIFWYWINERHRIYLKRKKGKSFPWTEDKILRTYKFTNVFRLLDRVTQELLKRVFTKKNLKRDLSTIVFNIVKFRMFNWPETYDELGGFSKRWDEKDAIKKLRQRQKRKQKVFTGAYIITNNGLKEEKIVLVCRSLTAIYKDRKRIAKKIVKYPRIEDWVEMFSEFPMIGRFIAYELATDVRYLAKYKVIPEPKDTYTWANAGPGAFRGLNRLHKRDLHTRISIGQAVKEMQALLYKSKDRLENHVPRLEMRDIEHSLCEYDKYMRVKTKEGRPRSKFVPYKN